MRPPTMIALAVLLITIIAALVIQLSTSTI